MEKIVFSLSPNIIYNNNPITLCLNIVQKIQALSRISVGNLVVISIHNVRKNYMLIFAYYSNKAISPLFDDLQYSLFIVCLHLYKEKKNWLYVQTKL